MDVAIKCTQTKYYFDLYKISRKTILQMLVSVYKSGNPHRRDNRYCLWGEITIVFFSWHSQSEPLVPSQILLCIVVTPLEIFALASEFYLFCLPLITENRNNEQKTQFNRKQQPHTVKRTQDVQWHHFLIKDLRPYQ